MTTARRCAGCGGPLPETPASQRQVTCAFCGVVNDLSHGAPQVIKVEVGDLGKVAGALGRKIRLAIWIGVGVAALVIAAAVLRVLNPIREALDDVDRQAQEMQERLRPVAPAELATLDAGGWKEVQVPAPPSDWTSFDPVRAIDWAMAIARAWQADAQLTRIDVSRATPAGTLDLSSDIQDRVGYRFVSPARVAEWQRIADRELNARVPYQLMLQVARQRVSAQVTRGRPPARALPPGPPDTRPLGDVIAAAIGSGRFTSLPYYGGYLTHLERDGWVWYLQRLSGRGSLPRVRARDGAVFPY